jgi:tRNA (adenine22-N1)-methyltransferase
MKISKRLQYIYAQVPISAHVIDVGADHSYVAIKLAQQNPDRRVIASDIAPLPLAAGRENAAKYGVKNIDFRLGSGLSVLKRTDKIDVAILAGIGGFLMTELLAAAPVMLNRYILQPNNETALVRAWLEAHGYILISDERIDDASHIYEVLIAERKTGQTSSYADDQATRAAEFFFGPPLARTHETVYTRWLETNIQHLTHLRAQMAKSELPDVAQTRAQYAKLIIYAQGRLDALNNGRAGV